MAEIQHGLIFNDGNGEIWMGVYHDGTIMEFSILSDFEGIYEDLELSKFAFVAIEDDANDQVWIKDVCTFEVGKTNENANDIDSVGVVDMLRDLEFPSEATDSMFGGFLVGAGKSN